MTPNKKDITQENLRLHNIEFVEEVYQDDGESARGNSQLLPDHVDAVREALLTFKGLVPAWEEWQLDLEEEVNQYCSEHVGLGWSLQPPASAIIPQKRHELRHPSAAAEAAHLNLKANTAIAEAARECIDEKEAGWTYFWRSTVFKTFSDTARTQPAYNSKLDTWSLNENFQWNEFPHWESPLPSLFWKARTDPKPDLTYAFPITKIAHRKGIERDDYLRSFSVEMLGELRRNGVHGAVTTWLHNWTKSPEIYGRKASNPDLCCFPWAVVEIKKEEESPGKAAEKCYCQAANAAGAALTLQARLLEKSFGKSHPNIPPVVAFTCVGPIVKVWLAHQTPTLNLVGKPQQRMVCIWTTSVQLTWGVTALQTIIANMHAWASRILKPKLSSWIISAFRLLDQNVPRHIDSAGVRTAQSPNFQTPTQLRTPKNDAELQQATPAIFINHNPFAFQPLRDVQPSRPIAFSSRPRSANQATAGKISPLFNFLLDQRSPRPKFREDELTQIDSHISFSETVRTEKKELAQGQHAGANETVSDAAGPCEQVQLEEITDSLSLNDTIDTDDQTSSTSTEYSESGLESINSESYFLKSDFGKIDVERANDEDFEPDHQNGSESETGSEDEEYMSSDGENEVENLDVLNWYADLRVSHKDIQRWRRASLQTLSGEQIATTWFALKIWQNNPTEWMRKLEQKLTYNPSAFHNNVEALESLLGFLVKTFGTENMHTDSLLKGQDNREVSIILQILQTTPSVKVYETFQKAIACLAGWQCVDFLSSGLAQLTVEEREKVDIEAFRLLNEEDQNSDVLI